ncbi:DNA polymerase III, subunit gamma and tau, partial [Candidatus Wolfebacteria bacterium RIFOXYB2_FULL_49_7]
MLALYRKYRPKRFEDVLGQESIIRIIRNAAKTDRLSHAYLFYGARGSGKTTTARLIAKIANCQKRLTDADFKKLGEPCNACHACIEIDSGNAMDIIEIDAASTRGIDDIRSLKEGALLSPSSYAYKVFIIDEVHMLSKDAFNALLKTLEEPPSHVFFILATTESHKVPETIISRCQRFDFKRVDTKSIVARLGYIAQHEKIEAELDALELIARNVDGGLRDAIGLMEQITFDGKLTYEAVKKGLGIAGHKAAEQLFEQILAHDVKKALATVSDIHYDGYDISQFTKDFLEYLREKMLDAVKNNDNELLARIIVMIDKFQGAYEAGRTAIIPQLPLEIAVVEVGSQKLAVS